MFGASNLIGVSYNGITAARTYLDVINDSNTVIWLDAQDLANIVKDGSNFVSSWGDKSGSSKKVVQVTNGLKPVWDVNGINFDGINDFLQSDTNFVVNQPAYMYIVVKSNTYVLNSRLLNDNMSNIEVWRSSTTNLVINAGTNLINSNYGTGTFYILRFLFNGAGSMNKIGINAASGNAGSSVFAGLTLGADVAFNNPSNMILKELLLRNFADGSSDSDLIYNYLKTKYGL